jgi:GT2 family glycosyltransferase
MKLNKQKEITIIVPIYNAYNEIINCLDSIMNTVSSLLLIEVLIINDGSSDERIKPLLEKYKQFTIVHNSQNMGYTKTINKAINLAEGKDIILLNSDTITTTGWIESLKSVAYSHEKIGTVTAMSDNAGAFSFPIQGKYNPKPKYMTYNNYAKLIIDQTAMCDIVEVTTGSGFCLYIKGKLIKEIGSFDEVLFPRGYGEENEFCLRAIRNGWKNVISPKTFIFHIRSASFGNEKSKLIEEGLAKVLERYPSYMQNVKKTFSSNSMKNLRAHAQKAVTMMGEEKDLIDG